jgi:hypothetical protein
LGSPSGEGENSPPKQAFKKKKKKKKKPRLYIKIGYLIFQYWVFEFILGITKNINFDTRLDTHQGYT